MKSKFVQKESKLDILFIVDNSPSMRREQEKLGERLQAFLKNIRHTDWQIAFTTSDVSNGKYGLKGSLLDLYNYPGVKVLDSKFPDAEEVFYNTVKRSESIKCIFRCPSSNEQPLKASILAIEKSFTENSNFFRKDADLAIVILSDEDEMSNGSRKATKPQDVVNAFNSTFEPPKKLSVYGIVIQPNDLNCYQDQKVDQSVSAHEGTVITELTKLTGGFTGSICENDYSVALEQISEQTRFYVESFKLKRSPIKESITVTLSPSQNVDWSIENDYLTFKSPPKDGTEVKVSYNYH